MIIVLTMVKKCQSVVTWFMLLPFQNVGYNIADLKKMCLPDIASSPLLVAVTLRSCLSSCFTKRFWAIGLSEVIQLDRIPAAVIEVYTFRDQHIPVKHPLSRKAIFSSFHEIGYMDGCQLVGKVLQPRQNLQHTTFPWRLRQPEYEGVLITSGNGKLSSMTDSGSIKVNNPSSLQGQFIQDTSKIFSCPFDPII